MFISLRLLNYTLAAYEDYIRLRLNGLSSPGTLKILKIWHGPKDKPRVVRMHMMPVSEFERVDKIPDVLDKMANTDYLTRHKSAKLYLFRDSDLVWLLEANEDQISCNFTDGFDGKHFHSQGFSEVFAKEFRHMGGKALSSQQLLELKARLKKSWNINWYCPSDIPIPGT